MLDIERVHETYEASSVPGLIIALAGGWVDSVTEVDLGSLTEDQKKDSNGDLPFIGVRINTLRMESDSTPTSLSYVRRVSRKELDQGLNWLQPTNFELMRRLGINKIQVGENLGIIQQLTSKMPQLA